MTKQFHKTSTITCPGCGSRSKETIPDDSCQFFWQCETFEQIIRPNVEDCCVFCSYGDNACPPVQKSG